MANKDNYEKLFSRLTKILERLYNGEVLQSSELAKDYDVSVRTIQRDFIERLEPSFPIERNGIKWKMIDGHKLARTKIQREIIVLDIMENMTKSLGTEIFTKSKNLLSKLKNDEESAFYTKLLFEDMSKNITDFEKLETAIKKQKVINFIHDNKKKFMKPYKILNLDGYWYICGVNTKTNRLTNIRISKTSLISVTDEYFVKLSDIDDKVKTAITGNFKPYRKLQNVELLIEDEPNHILKKIPISSTLKVIDRSDIEGWIHISLQVTDLAEITPFIKKNMPKVFVLSPQKLRERILNDVNEYIKKSDLYTI